MQGKGVSVSSMGVVREQGMCPHEIYLGTCTCIKVLKKDTAYMYSRMKNFLSFLGQKKSGGGGSLGKGVWEPTPHLL